MNWRFWSRQTRQQPDTCASLEPLLSLFSDGMTSPPETRRVETHLADCPECRRALEWMQVTRQVIARRPVAVPPPDLRMRIAQAIAAEAVPNTTFHPAPRSFVLRPAFAMAATVAIAAALTFHYSYQPHPSKMTSPRLPTVRTAINTAKPTVVGHPGKTTLPTPAKPPKTLVARSVSHAPLPVPVVRPDTGPRVAVAPEIVTHNPQTSVVPVVQSHVSLPHVKTHPATTSMVAGQPSKTISPRVTPVPVKHGPDVVATLPKTIPQHNDHEAVLSPPVAPDTMAIVHPATVPVQVATAPIPPVVHENALNRELSTMVAFRTDHSVRHIELDKNAHVQSASYNNSGTDKTEGHFVTLSAVYSPTSLPVNKQVTMASASTTK